MRFRSPLLPATLGRRYKRFLADVFLADGTPVTAHCANPGSMMGLNAPGSPVWLSLAPPGRKLAYGLEIVEADGTLVAINTGNPNRLAAEALESGRIAGIPVPHRLDREVQYGSENSRIDLLGHGSDGSRCWIEVKNCHLMRTPGLAEFPDSVTSRGAKHLRELARQVEGGDRAVLLFIIQRGDCQRLSFAADLDPGYARAAREAHAAGVEILAMDCHVSTSGIEVASPVPVEI
jgi:sugar fermentation stimulation protein A